ENGGRRDGILFVRHGRRATTPRGRRLRQFGDFGLHVEQKIVSDFRGGSGNQAESCGYLGDAFPLAVPRNAGERNRQFCGEELGDLGAAIAERGKRSSGAAKLKNQRTMKQGIEPFAMQQESVQPASSDVAEG